VGELPVAWDNATLMAATRKVVYLGLFRFSLRHTSVCGGHFPFWGFLSFLPLFSSLPPSLRLLHPPIILFSLSLSIRPIPSFSLCQPQGVGVLECRAAAMLDFSPKSGIFEIAI